MSLEKNDKFERSEYTGGSHDWDIRCDDALSPGCEGEIELQHVTFNEAIDIIKERSWQIYKNDRQEWCHRCPQCKEEKKQQAMERMRDEAKNDRNS